MRYTIKAAAIATGVSESRLRTWERRYGVPRPGRSASGRRLFNEQDLAVIRRMAALVGAGVPPSEAAASVLSEGVDLQTAPQPVQLRAHPLASTVQQASIGYDEPATVGALHEAVSSLGWAEALEQVLMPALRLLGRSWEENAIISANEHFTTELIRRQIAAALVVLPGAHSDAPVVLLACPTDERHELGLLALCLLLRERRLGTLYLGADVPTPDLLLAAKRTNIAAICLSATTPSGLASLARAAREIASARVTARLFVGGPALRQATDDVTVVGVTLPQSLAAAVELIVERLSQGVKT
jgi:DNA-binding transcriptional MerR regulator